MKVSKKIIIFTLIIIVLPIIIWGATGLIRKMSIITIGESMYYDALSFDDIRALNDEEVKITRLDINGKFTPATIKTRKDAVLALSSVRDVMSIGELSYSVEVEKSNFWLSKLPWYSDNPKNSFILCQRYKGLRVFRAGFTIKTNNKGEAKSVSGRYVHIDDLDVIPTLSKEQAKEIAGLRGNYKTELIVYDNLIHEGPPSLAWRFNSRKSIFDIGLVHPAYNTVIVDAHTGEVIYHSYTGGRTPIIDRIVYFERESELRKALSLDEIISLNDGDLKIVTETGVPNEIHGKFTTGTVKPPRDGTIKNRRDAVLALSSVRDVMNIGEISYSVKGHNRGGTHFTLYQYYKGLRVYDGVFEISVNEKSEGTSVVGRYVHVDDDLDVTPAISRGHIRGEVSLDSGERIRNIELMVFKNDGPARLVWCVYIPTNSVQERIVIVDANTGEVIFKSRNKTIDPDEYKDIEELMVEKSLG